MDELAPVLRSAGVSFCDDQANWLSRFHTLRSVRRGFLKLWLLGALVCISSCAPGLRILASEGSSRRLIANPRPQADATATTAETQRSGLRVLTFNAGLAPGVVARAEERAPEIARALASDGETGGGFDVACLQEVWLERHAGLLKRALGATSVAELSSSSSGRLPHPVWLSFPPEPVAGLYCGDAELTSLVGCVANSCLGESDVAGCALDHCRPVLDSLSGGCMACLGKDLSDPLAALAGCTEPATPAANLPKPYLLGGAYGTALVSRLPVLKYELIRLESTMHPRGVIYAQVLDPELGPVDTYCTHLTPFLRGVKHPTGGSFITEQSAQIERLIDITKPHGNIPVVLLGDLNTGPAGARAPTPYQARLPQHYARLLSAGFVEATSVQSCSFCYDNPIHARPDTGGLRIDHVLTRGAALRTEQEQRRFVTPSLSDHYAIELVLRAEKTAD